MKKHMIIYAKRPRSYHAKTRLGTSIGMAASAGIYARMLFSYLFDIIDNMGGLYRIVLSVAVPDDVDFFQSAFPELTVRSQVAGELGVRMAHSFNRVFSEGADCAVLTGSDIPGLNSRILVQAFTLLEQYKGVIGPAADGGYYLIGQHSPGYQLFTGIAWSTNTVLVQTEELAAKQGIKLAYLPTLSDVDNKADYIAWQEQIQKR